MGEKYSWVRIDNNKNNQDNDNSNYFYSCCEAQEREYEQRTPKRVFPFSQFMLAAIVLIIVIIPENWWNFRVVESSWNYND